MKSPKVLIALENPNLPIELDSSISISMLDLKEWILSGKYLKYIFHYRQSIIYAYRHELIDNPFVKYLAIWLISYGPSYIKDQNDTSIRITIPLLLKFFFLNIMELCIKPFKYRQFGNKVCSLTNKTNQVKQLNLSHAPIYLRTDNCQGLMAGGSVTHTAGVINNLSKFTGKPVYISPHIIPTINDEIEKHEVLPESKYRTFRQLRYLHYNEVLCKKTKLLASEKKLSFIYQRYSIENYSGVLLSNYFKIPLIIEYNGSEIWLGNKYGNPTSNTRLWESIEYLNLEKADLIVVVSQPSKDELVLKNFDEEKILVNPNGVDVNLYSPDIDGSNIRNKFRLSDKLVFGFIGTFGGWHGAEILAEAFVRLLKENEDYKKNVRLLMIGDGLKWNDVKKILSQNNINEECILTGLVQQAEGPNYLAACDFLVSPHVPNPDGTAFFGSPTKLFEYMAMGKGIIASNLDQIGDVLSHNKTAIMVKPGDPDDLKDALKIFINDPEYGEKLGKAVRLEAVAKYTWKEHTGRIVQKLNDLYN